MDKVIIKKCLNNKLYLNTEDRNIMLNLLNISKKIYNLSIELGEKHFKEHKKYLSHFEIMKIICRMKYETGNEWIDLLLSKCTQNTINSYAKAFKSYFALKQKYMVKGNKYPHDIRKPKLLNQEYFTLTYSNQSFFVFDNKIRLGMSRFYKKLNPYNTFIEIPYPEYLRKDNIEIKEIRVVIKYQTNELCTHYIYDETVDVCKDMNLNTLSIDLGIKNFLSVFSYSKTNISSFIIRGNNMKEANWKCNYSLKNKSINKLTKAEIYGKRNNKVNHFLHQYINMLLIHCKKNNIKNIVIGYNKGWRKRLGICSNKTFNIKFQYIPYGYFIHLLETKSKEFNINVETITEEFTSICSSIDLENIEKQIIYKGKRVKRGLFKTSEAKYINSDINGALNILRKYKNYSVDQEIKSDKQQYMNALSNPKIID